MELIVKLYNDKPSKIAVKYPQEYSAVRAYEDIFNKKGGNFFSLKMEMLKGKIDLVLISEETGERIFYKGLDYKIEQLKKMQAFLKPGSDLQFVHVFSKTNILMVARPFRSHKFITVNKYEIVDPAGFANTL